MQFLRIKSSIYAQSACICECMSLAGLKARTIFTHKILLLSKKSHSFFIENRFFLIFSSAFFPPHSSSLLYCFHSENPAKMGNKKQKQKARKGKISCANEEFLSREREQKCKKFSIFKPQLSTSSPLASVTQKILSPSHNCSPSTLAMHLFLIFSISILSQRRAPLTKKFIRNTQKNSCLIFSTPLLCFGRYFSFFSCHNFFTPCSMCMNKKK